MERNNNPGNQAPSVYAVILCTNETEDAIKCIGSLLEVDYPNLRIILVDNASTDGGSEKIARLFPSVKIMVREQNEGYSAGNNTGIREALRLGAEYVLISNSDIIVDKYFMAPLIEVAEYRNEVGLVIGTIRYTSHPDQLYYAAGKFSRFLCTGMNLTSQSSIAAESQIPIDVDFVNGALFLIKRKVFEEVGLMEERFFLYYDDLEFSRRCGRKFRMVYDPRSIAFHKSGAGKGWRSYTENYLYYSARNRFWSFQSEPTIYRLYVLCFSFANAVAKSLFVSMNFLTDPNRAWNQLRAIWRGTKDGIGLLFVI